MGTGAEFDPSFLCVKRRIAVEGERQPQKNEKRREEVIRAIP